MSPTLTCESFVRPCMIYMYGVVERHSTSTGTCTCSASMLVHRWGERDDSTFLNFVKMLRSSEIQNDTTKLFLDPTGYILLKHELIYYGKRTNDASTRYYTYITVNRSKTAPATEYVYQRTTTKGILFVMI